MGKLIVLLVAVCCTVVQCIKLDQKYLWKELEYAWPSEAEKTDALASGRYKVENNLPLGLDIWHDKLFITVPRYVPFAAKRFCNIFYIIDIKMSFCLGFFPYCFHECPPDWLLHSNQFILQLLFNNRLFLLNTFWSLLSTARWLCCSEVININCTCMSWSAKIPNDYRNICVYLLYSDDDQRLHSR